MTAEPSLDTRPAVCLSVDLEPDLRCPEKRIRLLDDDARLTQLLELLREEQVPLTVFTVMSHARRYLDRINVLANNATVELAVHSFSHDTDHPASDYEVSQAAAVFGELWNRKPFGYRAPNCLIDDRGIDALTRAGFLYDSSVVPSIRFDKYAYNNLHFGRAPFLFAGPSGTLVELPIACLAGVRLPIVFSYVKLLGLLPYQLLSAVCRPPDVVVTYFHPYDLYVDDIASNIPGWKRHAHLRNSRSAFRLLRGLIVMLKARGYRFELMKDLALAQLKTDLPTRTLALAA